MSAPVTVYQAVHTSDSHGWDGNSSLFRKVLDMDFLPPERAMFHISTDENGHDSVGNYVKRVYWSADGSVNVELVDWHVNPGEMMQLACDGNYRRAWWTERDGDLVQLLTENGWTR